MFQEAHDIGQLVARCLAGDDVAKAEFVNTYSESIRRGVAGTLARMAVQTPVRQDVEDIANDILVRLLADGCAKLAQVRDRQRLGAWLTVLTRNQTVDYVRRWAHRMEAQGLAVREEPNDSIQCPIDALIAEEALALAQRLLDELPAREKLVLSLYYLQGLKYAEIAAITGQNINTVATQIRRARERLRELFGAADSMEGASHASST